ncbi:hypothetical protein ABW20_dc0100279 [Dactylellina cionopaga]|nr:hypothetical protein ABW20_dc0100279 [Dactylellina cionopaga]
MKQEICNGILVDGFPRCMEQLNSWNIWPFPTDLTLKGGSKPDIVVSFKVTKEIAKARYLARGRDSNDTENTFEKRFVEYESETLPLEEAYQKRGMLVEFDANGTKEENFGALTKNLEESSLWQRLVANGDDGKSFFIV